MNGCFKGSESTKAAKINRTRKQPLSPPTLAVRRTSCTMEVVNSFGWPTSATNGSRGFWALTWEGQKPSNKNCQFVGCLLKPFPEKIEWFPNGIKILQMMVVDLAEWMFLTFYWLSILASIPFHLRKHIGNQNWRGLAGHNEPMNFKPQNFLPESCWTSWLGCFFPGVDLGKKAGWLIAQISWTIWLTGWWFSSHLASEKMGKPKPN